MKLGDLYPTRPHLRSRFVERLWSKIDTSGGPDACWPWTAARTTHRYGYPGYGRIGIAKENGGWMPAHRAIFLVTQGEISDGMFVLHTCDWPPCCNPAHLFEGTAKSNAMDRDSKRRQNPGVHRTGTESPLAVLTPAQVAQTRKAVLIDGISPAHVAADFGVSVNCIQRSLNGSSYKDVPATPDAPTRAKRLRPEHWTHCINGHEFTSENTMVLASGARRCRECQLEHQRIYARRKRAEAKVSE